MRGRVSAKDYSAVRSEEGLFKNMFLSVFMIILDWRGRKTRFYLSQADLKCLNEADKTGFSGRYLIDVMNMEKGRLAVPYSH